MKTENLLHLTFLLIIYYIIAITAEDVNTTSGIVRGHTINVLDKEINEFLNIPYAKPPIGKLRFARPELFERKNSGVIDATKTGYSCIQMSLGPFNDYLNTSEDCLVLNIWAPKQVQPSKPLPVMFWIHGGGMVSGSIFQLPYYNGSVLATHDVIIVTANYRLGPFGQFYGATQELPGNLGLYDQLTAMRWVYHNIEKFGGDSDQVTIFGESAGSVSVSAHILSPLSGSFFSRAILQSSADMHSKDRGVITTDEALEQSYQMAIDLGCRLDDQWLDCLRSVPAQALLPYTSQSMFANVLDKTEFVPEFAQDYFIKEKNPKEIDILAGVVLNEGSLPGENWLEEVHLNDEKGFNELVLKTHQEFHAFDIKNVSQLYLNNVTRNDSNALRMAFYDLLGDIGIICPTYHFTKQYHSSYTKGKTYFYQLTYQNTDYAMLPCDEKTMGICHMADIPFVFGTFLITPNNSDIDIQFSKAVMKMWTNFAKTGDPGYNWPQMTDSGQSIVKHLNPNDINGVLIDPFKHNCDEFWKNYFGITTVYSKSSKIQIGTFWFIILILPCLYFV